jgi:nucleoside-diphosphate-sugar epimerase
MPYIAQVAVGRREKLTVFGSDFETVDGTGVRDYVHVMDIAEGHVAAVRAMLRQGSEGVRIYNLGTGNGELHYVKLKKKLTNFKNVKFLNLNVIFAFFFTRNLWQGFTKPLHYISTLCGIFIRHKLCHFHRHLRPRNGGGL